MIIDREKHIKFLKDEYRAESEVFKKKFLTQAISLLKDTGEMYVGKFIAFKDGAMIMKFPNTRNLPRKGEHLFCMLLPNDLQNYNNWGNRTYADLFKQRYKGTDSICIWHTVTEDPRFSLVGFYGIDLEFAQTMLDNPGNILVFAPQRPPLEYISNLKEIAEDFSEESISSILDKDFQVRKWRPILIQQDDVTAFVKKQMSLSDIMVLQGPPGTGKTYMIAELCSKFCSEGKSVLVTALTNRALMELAEKPFLNEMLKEGRVFKTNLTLEEKKECKELQPMKQIVPMPSCLVLSTFYITSGFAKDLNTTQPFDVVIMDEASQAFLAMFAALKKVGKKNLWVGDITQLAPIVTLKKEIVDSLKYEPLIKGLEQIANSSEEPIYQLTSTYRFNERAAKYTGIFYNDTLCSKKNRFNLSIPFCLHNLVNSEGGPSLILSEFTVGDYIPEYAINMATALVGNILRESPKKGIAVLTGMLRTAHALENSIFRNVGSKNNIIVDTIARVQGLTTDITILVIPNVSYWYSLNPQLFNVATSRAKEHTIIIADKDIFNFGPMDLNVRRFLEKLKIEQMVFIPYKQNGSMLEIEE